MPIQSKSLSTSGLNLRQVNVIEPVAATQVRVAQPVVAHVANTGTVVSRAPPIAVSGTVLQPSRPTHTAGGEFSFPILVNPVIFGYVLNAPKPRDQIKVPISPTRDFNDLTAFEAPANPAVKHKLPSYTVAEVTLEGQKRFRMAIEKIENDGWKLIVYIVQQPVQSSISVLEHTLSAELKFGQTIAKSLPLSLEKESETTWKAALLLPETVDRDEVYQALTDSQYKTALIVHRSVQVAVPVENEPGGQPGGQQLYKVEQRDLSSNLRPDPFIFPRDVHPYIFEEVINVSNKPPGYTLRTAEWKGRMHHYLQDNLRPHTFRYLPDSLKVTRKPAAPHKPNMLVHFSSEDGTLEKMRVNIEYVAAPVVDLERLQAAAEALKAFLPSPLPPNVSGPYFEPLVVSSIEQLELQLALPRAGTSGAPLQTRPSGVVTNLTDHFPDEIADLTVDQFQTVFDAMFGESAVVFQGRLLVKGGNIMPDESVPFAARFNDLVGSIFEEIEHPQPDGSINVQLINRIESPVELRSIPVKVLCDGKLIDAHVEKILTFGASNVLPIRMVGGEEIRLKVVPDQPVNVNSQLEAIFDLDDVEVIPDNAALWSAILDTSVPAYTRTISVNVFAEWFDAASDLIAIGIDFENGDSLVLKKDKLEGQAKVRTSLEDYILRKIQEPEYRYTLIKVLKNGQQTRKVLTANGDLLIPDISA